MTESGRKMKDRKPMQLRLPIDLKTWIAEQAEKNGSSLNSEVTRCIRERFERLDTEDSTPT